MPKCPKCKQEIDKLCYDSKVAVTQIFTVDGNRPEYSVMDYGDDHSNDKYRCPECDKTLFTKEDKAIEFLKGLIK